MKTDFAFDVFLSHNHVDKPRVRQLAERLRGAGLRVWFDEWTIRAGDIIALKVDEGLEQSRVLVLCISPNALASGWVALERSTAVHRDPANAERRFVPLMLTSCELPDTLRRYKYVDFHEETVAAFNKLLAACRIEEEEAAVAVKPAPKKELRTRKSRDKKRPKDEFARARPLAEKQPAQTEPIAVLERKFVGHTKWVYCLAVSPDGKWVASGSIGEAVKIWELETGDCKAALKNDIGQVRSLAITPDGMRVLLASADTSIRVWEPRSDRKLARLGNHTSEAWAVVALQDNTRALSGGRDNTLRLWDLNLRVCLKCFRCGKDASDQIFSCAVNPTGTQALSGHRNGRIRLWNLATEGCLATLEGHSSTVNSVRIAPDGQFAVSGSSDRTVKIWDLTAGTCVGTLEGHQTHVTSVAISPDGALIASSGFTDSTVRLWDFKSGACVQVIANERYGAPMSVAFSPEGSRLVVGTADGEVWVFRLTKVHPAPSAESTRRYVNAKVVLLGEGTVGKTSLAHRLIEDRYVIRDRTHGMNVWRLDLPLPPDDTLEREALLWDLAGQEDYRLVHQLFLDETALALLLINPQKDNPFAEAGDWLKALATAARNQDSKREAARLAIFSQVDVGEPKLGKAKLDRFCEEHAFTDWLLTSAKTGRNCSDHENGGKPSPLKQLIADRIPWDKLPWTSTPRLLAELKSAVMAMRDKADIRLLRFAELGQRLEQALPSEPIRDADVRTAVTLLANQGMVSPLKFGDLVLLAPELLNGYSGAIIRAARSHLDEIGCVCEAEIYKPNFDFTGIEQRLPRADEELLLRALVQTLLEHSLCIAEETPHGRHLVFPSQYRREKDIPRDPEIFVSYTFSGEWQTVWTTLVVRLWYSEEFAHKELWRNAAEFASGKGNTLGLKIDNQQGEGRATISLYFDKDVADELKAIFIEYVHRHLARYACEVSRDRRYVCPDCGKSVRDIEAVRNRLLAKKEFITCQECDERVPLLDFIEQRLKSDPVARKIFAMDATATRQLDAQALEQILIGHMMAIAGEANQIFRPLTMFDYGIDGEVEFKDNDGKASGKRIYVQLKSGNSYLRTRQSDGSEVFDVKNDRHLEYWLGQPVDVYLVVRQTDEITSSQTIRWMNVTQYLKLREDKQSRQVIFQGEKLDMAAVWKARDGFFPNVGMP